MPSPCNFTRSLGITSRLQALAASVALIASKPAIFSFAPKIDVDPSTETISDPVVLVGYSISIPFTVEGDGLASVNGGAWVSSGTLPPTNPSVRLKTTSSADGGASKSPILNANGIKGSFTVKTKGAAAGASVPDFNSIFGTRTKAWIDANDEYAGLVQGLEYAGPHVSALKDKSPGKANDFSAPSQGTPTGYDYGCVVARNTKFGGIANNTVVVGANGKGMFTAPSSITLGNKFAIFYEGYVSESNLPTGFVFLADGQTELTLNNNQSVGNDGKSFSMVGAYNNGGYGVYHFHTIATAIDTYQNAGNYLPSGFVGVAQDGVQDPDSRFNGSGITLPATQGTRLKMVLICDGSTATLRVNGAVVHSIPWTTNHGTGRLIWNNLNPGVSPAFSRYSAFHEFAVVVGDVTNTEIAAAESYLDRWAAPLTPVVAPPVSTVVNLSTTGTNPFKTSKTLASMTAGSPTVTVASTAGFAVGDAVIVEIGGTFVSFAPKAGNTGNGLFQVYSKWPYLTNTTPGVYKVTFVSATQYTVTDPNNAQVGSAATIDAEWANQICFYVREGSTPFVTGDRFDVTVSVTGETALQPWLDNKPAAGRLRTMGVGGVGPAQAVNSESAGFALTAQQGVGFRIDNTSDGANHGKAYYPYYDEGANVQRWSSAWDGGNWPACYAEPRALLAKITAIPNGTTLTLDKNAQASTAGVYLWYDNAQAWDYWMQQGGNRGGANYYGTVWTEFTVNTGSYALSRPLDFVAAKNNGIKFGGAGWNSTYFVSPRGTQCNMLSTSEMDNINFYGFEYVGNWGVGNTFSQNRWADVGVANPTLAQSSNREFPFSIIFGGYKGYMHDIRTRNIVSGAGSLRYGRQCLIKDCEHIQEHPLPGYAQWWYQHANSVDCVTMNCWVESISVLGAFEPFQCLNSWFINCGGINVLASDNSSGGTKYVRPFFYNDRDVATFYNSLFNPIMQTNANVDTSQNPPLNITNISIGANAVITTATPHSRSVGDVMYFPPDSNVTGTLPAPFARSYTPWYVQAVPSSTTLVLKASRTGSPVTTSGTFSGSNQIRLFWTATVDVGLSIIDPVIVQAEYAFAKANPSKGVTRDKSCRNLINTQSAPNCKLYPLSSAYPRGLLYRPDYPAVGGNDHGYLAIRPANPDLYIEGINMYGVMTNTYMRSIGSEQSSGALLEIANCGFPDISSPAAYVTSNNPVNAHDNKTNAAFQSAYPRDFRFDPANPLAAKATWKADWQARLGVIPSGLPSLPIVL